MKPQQLTTFLAVAENRSIRAAARALLVSQPAVTRTLRELERDLDIALVRRSVAGIELTDAGMAFQVRAGLLLAEMDRAREELLFMKEGGHGHVTVAMTSTAGMTLLPAALDAFTRRMPQARISITESVPPAALRKLQDGTLDFAIANSLADSLPSEFEQEPLFMMDLVIGARTKHPMSKATTLTELQDQLWVVPSRNQDFFSQLFVSRGLEVPARVLECDSFAIMTHLIGRTDLLGVFSAALFEQELVPRGVAALPLRDRLSPVEVGALTLRNSRFTPTAQFFMECLKTRPLPPGMHPVKRRRL